MKVIKVAILVASMFLPSTLTADQHVQEAMEKLKELMVGNDGDIIQGWFISRGKSPLDDSPKVLAIKFESDSEGAGRSSITLACEEDVTRLVVGADRFLLGRRSGIDVAYRIDDAPAVDARWNLATSRSHAGLWGASAAAPFIRSLIGKERLFVQLTERDGRRHRATFRLAGIEEVAAEIAATCGWALEP